MKTDTSKKIIQYITKQNGHVAARDMVDFLGISKQALFKHLARLLEDNKIYKVGKPPHVFYSVTQKNIQTSQAENNTDPDTIKILEKSFLIITPAGERKEGAEGFSFWCRKTKQPFKKTAEEYIKTLKKYETFKKQGLIDGMKKLKSSFKNVFLDHLFYLDFYSIERFGKTKLGQMLLYAKQSQNKTLIKELIYNIQPQITMLIRNYKIDAVGFIPPTVKREIQFMKELERNLKYDVRRLNLVKIKTEVAVPQKTLNKLEDRIENARHTIIVDDKNHYNNILLIDDAVGSGATLNETAYQIKSKKLCTGKIIGLAITGSFKGFDVISEV